MASKFSEAICETYFNSTEGALLRNVIDAELQEVRELITDLVAFVSGERHDEQDIGQRARALLERLHPKGD